MSKSSENSSKTIEIEGHPFEIRPGDLEDMEALRSLAEALEGADMSQARDIGQRMIATVDQILGEGAYDLIRGERRRNFVHLTRLIMFLTNQVAGSGLEESMGDLSEFLDTVPEV